MYHIICHKLLQTSRETEFQPFFRFYKKPFRSQARFAYLFKKKITLFYKNMVYQIPHFLGYSEKLQKISCALRVLIDVYILREFYKLSGPRGSWVCKVVVLGHAKIIVIKLFEFCVLHAFALNKFASLFEKVSSTQLLYMFEILAYNIVRLSSKLLFHELE